MDTKIPVPFTGQTIDVGSPTDAAMTFVLLVGGFAAFFFAQDLGGDLKSTVSEIVGFGSESNDRNIL